jgi:SAM-dependent methyltransferase
MRVDGLRDRLIEQIGVQAGERVLDVGCGTGTLLLRINAAQPAAVVVGVDPDPDILSIAREKAKRAGVEIDLEVGFADRLPYADGTFDRVDRARAAAVSPAAPCGGRRWPSQTRANSSSSTRLTRSRVATGGAGRP